MIISIKLIDLYYINNIHIELQVAKLFELQRRTFDDRIFIQEARIHLFGNKRTTATRNVFNFK